MKGKWREVDRWFREAQDQEPDRRVRFLEDRCLDTAVRAEVLEMLARDSVLSATLAGLPTALRAGIGAVQVELQQSASPAGPESPDTPWIGSILVDPDTGQERWEILEVKARLLSLVYIGVDRSTEHSFAAKTYRASVFEASPDLVRSLEQEAGVWIRLPPHPNVAVAERVQRLQGKPYLFMEYYARGDLAQLIETGALRRNLPGIVYYAMQICDGLAHAYAHQVRAHRDVKPGNCLLFGHVGLAVTDFGLAKPSGPADEISPGWGTPAYMAPEQWVDKATADERTDIYALGATVFEMITGQKVFGTVPDRSEVELRRRHETEPVPPLGTSPGLSAIVRRCLEKDPARRFQTARELRLALEDIFRDLTGTAAPLPHRPHFPEDDPSLLHYRANQLDEVGWRSQADELYERARRIEPDNAAVIHDHADMLFRAQRFEAARREAERAVELQPDMVEGWLTLGNARDELGDHEGALLLYERAVALAPHPHLGRAHYDHGVCLERLGRTAEAEVAYRRAIECRPDLELALSNLGSILRERGAFEEAIAVLERAVEVNPAREEAWFHLGHSLLALGRLDESQACMERALTLEKLASRAHQ